MKYKNHKVLGKQLIPETNKPNIVNINFVLNSLHFDAADMKKKIGVKLLQ